MAQNEGVLSSKQKRAILALLATNTVIAAAKMAGIGLSTLEHWLSDPTFRAYLAGAEVDMIDAATRKLLQLQDSAIDTVTAIMQDGEANAFVRLRAAQIVIDSLLRLRELRNLEQRIVALELAYAHEQSQAPR